MDIAVDARTSPWTEWMQGWSLYTAAYGVQDDRRRSQWTIADSARVRTTDIAVDCMDIAVDCTDIAAYCTDITAYCTDIAADCTDIAVY